jgi:hypothetical protein
MRAPNYPTVAALVCPHRSESVRGPSEPVGAALGWTVRRAAAVMLDLRDIMFVVVRKH